MTEEMASRRPHGDRSKARESDFRSRALVGALALASAALAACANTGEDSSDLNAILEDGDLTQVTRAALSAPSPAAPPMTGAAGTVGSAGTTGASGTTGAAGAIVGSAGATGAAGATVGSAGATGAAGGAVDGGATGGAAGTGIDDGGGGSTGMGTGTAGTGCEPKGCGMGGSGGGGSSGFPFPQSAQGLWMFEDCNTSRTDLGDSTFSSHTAFRSVSAACAAGSIQGQGIAIDGSDDLVYVPDQPSFTFDNGLTVAAWVKPTKLGGIRTIFRKREDGTSTFVLLENGQSYQLVIRLANGRAAEVDAKAKLGTFTHVAGTYDGNDLRLYLNGTLAAHTRVHGTLSGGAGPLLMGNDGSLRHLDGVIDSVFFDTLPATPDQIARLACLPTPSKLVATPLSSGLVPAGTDVPYDIALTNNSCDSGQAFFSANQESGDLFVTPSSDFRQIAAGGTEHFSIDVSSSTTIAPDDYGISIFASVNTQTTNEFLQTTVTYSVLGTPCSVRPRKEIEIRDLSVVEDPVRTAAGGVWTFGALMENMAPTAAQAPAMVEALLDTWLTDQNVNGFTVGARPAMQDLILTPFPRKADGSLDLSQAPFRLLAIVNRIDLNNVASGSAGEGRFVFGVLDQFGNPLQLTMIVEYNIPAGSAQDVTDLANAWHGLSSLPFPSTQYNSALQAITDRFTTRGAAPGRPNGSALGQVRSNDFFTLGEWEFREFHLSATSGNLEPASPALTPDASFNGTDALARYINANQASILTETHTVPATFEGQPFAAGSLITDFFIWQAPGVDPEARHKFARNTCNGCHTSPLETGTGVFQVQPRSLGQESFLSPFLTGTQVFDPFANVLRNFNELDRRARKLHDLVCPNEMLPPPPPDTIPVGGPGGDGGGGAGGGFDGGDGTGGAGGIVGSDGGFSGAGGSFPAPDGGVTGAAGVGGKL
jgi:Concanavalin A-like lectin/glucanases superfamily